MWRNEWGSPILENLDFWHEIHRKLFPHFPTISAYFSAQRNTKICVLCFLEASGGVEPAASNDTESALPMWLRVSVRRDLFLFLLFLCFCLLFKFEFLSLKNIFLCKYIFNAKAIASKQLVWEQFKIKNFFRIGMLKINYILLILFFTL